MNELRAIPGGVAPREMNLNERLDGALSQLERQLTAVEEWFVRAQGGPITGTATSGDALKRPPPSLAENVERAETVTKRMDDIHNQLDRIA